MISPALSQPWPIWLVLALGALGSRRLFRTGDGDPNLLLRGAGVFRGGPGAGRHVVQLPPIETLSFPDSSTDLIVTAIYVAEEIVGGVLAGLVLRRASPAASVLMAALILSALALTLPLALRNGEGAPNMPPEMLFLQWSGVAATILAAAVVLGARLFVRRPEAGTIS